MSAKWCYSQWDFGFDWWASKRTGNGVQFPTIPNFASDTIWSAGARFIGTSVDTANNTAGTKEWMNVGPMHRMGMTANYISCDFYIDGTASNISWFNIRFWRRNDPTSKTDISMHLVDSTGDIHASLVNGYNKIYFASPIALHEQDYYSVQAVFGTTNVIAFTTVFQNSNNPNTDVYSDTCKMQTYFETNLTNKVWQSDTSYAGVRAFPIRFYSKSAPQFIIAGNSMYEGNYHTATPQYAPTLYQNNQSMIAPYTTLGQTYYPGWDIDQTVGKKIADYFGYTYQNRSRGGWTTTSINGWFDSNVVKQKPKFVLVDGGLNDPVGTSALTLIQMKSIVYKCTQNHLPVIFLAITPTNWHGRTQAQVLTYDTINNAMATWMTTQRTDSSRWWVQWLNVNQYIGEQRDTGTPLLPTPNYWNMPDAYTSDGLHFNNAGATIVAQKNIDLIQSMFDTVGVNIEDNTVVTTPIVEMPLSLNAGIYALWGIDSIGLSYTINGGATQLANKLTLISGSQYQGVYGKSFLPNAGVLADGDIIRYTLTAYEKGGLRTASKTTTVTLDSLAPMPVLTGLQHWYYYKTALVSPVAYFSNCIDTTRFRQATVNSQPTFTTAINCDTTRYLSRVATYYNDSLTYDFLIKIPDTNTASQQIIWATRVSTPITQVVSMQIATNASTGINKLLTGVYNGTGGYSTKDYRTSEITGWLGNFARFTMQVDSTNRQDLYINNTKLLISSAAVGATFSDNNVFYLNQTGKNISYKIFLDYSRKLTTAEMLTNQTFFDYYIAH